ncbi:hypothetical protein HELRODRAFT_165331 [Helobdella robusta]|uniref:Uncharacterized protein n=1 Tax=Helobdella robusta TaxID=6412 RepID=T1EWL4_HELRO|nr:hypothetical protein HELRODRAFT_165331 [Helobdella robusta]ESN91317.1 hypothetical protein HELRODRAFT_165331 [Helobdella robusta]
MVANLLKETGTKKMKTPLRIKEALYIHKNKPSLNKQINTFDHTLQLFSQYYNTSPLRTNLVRAGDGTVQRHSYQPGLDPAYLVGMSKSPRLTCLRCFDEKSGSSFVWSSEIKYLWHDKDW